MTLSLLVGGLIRRNTNLSDGVSDDPGRGVR